MSLAEDVSLDLEVMFKALASERRLQILDWLKNPSENFPPQEASSSPQPARAGPTTAATKK